MPPLDVEFIDIDCLVNCIDWLLALLINVNMNIGLSLVLVRGKKECTCLLTRTEPAK